MTQRELIEKYINDFGSITPFDAFMDLGITKLATRVSEMRKLGFKFNKKWEKTKNRYGKPVAFMRYSWKGEDDEVSKGTVSKGND